MYMTNVKPWCESMLKESAILLCLHRIIWCVPQNYININKEIRNKDSKVLFWK